MQGFVALHNSLVELTLRIGRCEEKLGLHLESMALATFANVPPPHEPAPARPCSCEESVQLRARVRKLAAELELLRPIGWVSP